MKIKVKALIAGLLIFLVALAGFVLLRTQQKQTFAVQFQGWTNALGVKQAIFVFPKVTSAPPGRRFYKWRYALRLEFDYLNKDGTATSGFFEDSGGPIPNRSSELKVPIPETAVSVKVTKAESTLYRYWDFARPRMPPREKRWVFSLPQIPTKEGDE